MSSTSIPNVQSNVANRIAQQTLARRGPDYESEVRRLLDAALEVMRECGTRSRPRVADIVATAGLSNDAFYRHFRSKDELVTAIVEDGAQRLASYAAHQMAKASTPKSQVRSWVKAVLSQAADEDLAATTLAVIWNGDSLGEGLRSGRPTGSEHLAPLLHEPFEQLGSSDPALDASLAAHATLGKLSEYLWRRVRPTRSQIDHIADCCLRMVTS